MNSVHDLGGMHGLGPVLHKENEPVFQADWEGRMFGLLLAVAALGKFNGDEFRHAQERIDPASYLSISYYHRWLLATEALLRETGILPTSTASVEEAASRALPASSVDAFLARGGSSRLRQAAEARFRPGDEIVARNINPIGHTRLPRYVRGKCGTVVLDDGVWAFADTNAHRKGRNPQHLYRVRFAAHELWGREASDLDVVFISLWEDHMDHRSKVR